MQPLLVSALVFSHGTASFTEIITLRISGTLILRSPDLLPTLLILGSFPCDRYVCIDYPSLRFIHSVTTVKHTIHLCTIGCAKRVNAFQEQNAALNIIHSSTYTMPVVTAEYCLRNRELMSVKISCTCP